MLLPALLLIGGAITAGLWALLVPMKDRALMPVLGGLTSLGRRFTPVGYVDGVRRKFSALGVLGNEPVDRFLAMRVVTIAVVPIAFIVVYAVLGMRGMMAHA